METAPAREKPSVTLQTLHAAITPSQDARYARKKALDKQIRIFKELSTKVIRVSVVGPDGRIVISAHVVKWELSCLYAKGEPSIVSSRNGNEVDLRAWQSDWYALELPAF